MVEKPNREPGSESNRKGMGVYEVLSMRQVKAKKLAQLKAGIQLYWKKMTPEVCRRYIHQLEKVIPDVLKVDGGHSGHYDISLF